LAVSATAEFREDGMPKRRSTQVWVKLQIGEEEAAFAESQWRKFGYFSRDDYLNGLLNGALMSAMTEEPLKLGAGPEERPDSDRDDDLPF
jgi:hypothetical protein